MECNICSLSVDRCIGCPSCNGQACVSCWTQYFSSRNNHQCMYCPLELNYNQLTQILSTDYLIAIYPDKQKNILFDREKLSLNARIETVVQLKDIRAQITTLHNSLEHYKVKIRENEFMMDKIKANIVKIHTHMNSQTSNKLNRQMLAINDIHSVYTKEIAKNRAQIILLQQNIKELIKPQKSPQPTRSYICACISKKCRGFINNQGQCMLCNIQICLICHEQLVDNHQCNKDTLESLNQINISTKQCPTCKTRIQKSEGCDQMFCTICHTKFCYYNGRIIDNKEEFHNPHFTRRDAPGHRELNQDDNDFPNYGDFMLVVYEQTSKKSENYFNPSNLNAEVGLNIYSHIQRITNECQTNYGIPVLDSELMELQTIYLIGDIDEFTWKECIYSMYMTHQLHSMVFPVLQKYINQSLTLVIQFMRDKNLHTLITNHQILYNCLLSDIHHIQTFYPRWNMSLGIFIQ